MDYGFKNFEVDIKNLEKSVDHWYSEAQKKDEEIVRLKKENENLNIHVSALIVENDSLKKVVILQYSQLEEMKKEQ